MSPRLRQKKQPALEPGDIDKAGSEASEEGTHGLSKMFALFVYCTEFFKSRDYEDLSREKNHFDHVSLSDEEIRDIKKELDDVENKFDEARAAKLKCSQ